MSNKNAKPKNTIFGLVIFLIVMFGNSFRAIFNSSTSNLGLAIALPIIISFIIPLVIVIAVIKSVKAKNAPVDNDKPTTNYYTKEAKYKNHNSSDTIRNKNNTLGSDTESFYDSETRKARLSKYSRNARKVKAKNKARNTTKRNYANNANERSYESNANILSSSNMPTEAFPCAKCGTMLQPGTLFCFHCDTKVDYSRFK